MCSLTEHPTPCLDLYTEQKHRMRYLYRPLFSPSFFRQLSHDTALQQWDKKPMELSAQSWWYWTSSVWKNPMLGRLWEELSGKMSVIDTTVTDLQVWHVQWWLEASTFPLWSTYSVILTWECVKGFHMVRTITNPVRNTWLVQNIAKENVSLKIVFRSWKSHYQLKMSSFMGRNNIGP